MSRTKPNWWLIGAGLAAVLLLLAYYMIFLRDDASPQLENRVGSAVDKTEQAVAKAYFAVLEANIRDKPGTQDSSIIGKVARGESVSGTMVSGGDGSGEWLQLAEGRGFVALINFSETQPPELTRMLGDKQWTSDRAIEIWSQPDTASTLIDRIGAGTAITLVGLTANDFIEVKLNGGGVGYVAGGARIAALAEGKPIAIAFDPDRCSFGLEIDRMLAAMGERIRANYREIENREYPDEAARERALAAIEGKSTFQRLQRNYEGLTVTAIAQHYESQSVYFAEPAARVIEVFRGKGHRIGRDGQFAGTELYAGIGATQAAGARFGRSDLSCGV